MQNAFSGPVLEMEWQFPLTLGGMNAARVEGLYDDLIRAGTATPALTGALAAYANTLTVASPLISHGYASFLWVIKIV